MPYRQGRAGDTIRSGCGKAPKSVEAVARAEAANITVRVVARNAQYVGDLVDDAFVTITDAANGEVLAQGTTSGMPVIRNARCRPHANAVN